MDTKIAKDTGMRRANAQALLLAVALGMGASSCLVSSVSEEDESALETYQMTGGSGGGGNLSNVSSCAQNAFRQAMHPVLANACSSCHSDEHGSTNPTVAYGSAKAKSNFNNPSNSTLARYAGDGHCGQCGTATRTAVVTGMTTWGQAEAGNATVCAEFASAPDGGGGTVKPFDLGAYTPPNPNNTVIVQAGLTEFASAGGVHSMLVANCAQCHIPGGLARLAPFAVGDSTASYREAKPRSNLANVDASLMMTKAATPNHGTGCTICGNATFVNNLRAEMNAWAQQEAAAVQAAHVRVSNLRVYRNGNNLSLTTSNYATSVTLTWSLSTTTTPARNLPGASFRVTLNMLNASTYRFTNPQLVVGGQAIRVKKLTFIVNNVYRSEVTSYHSVDMLAAANGTRTLATFPALMSAPSGNDADIAVDFELLE